MRRCKIVIVVDLVTLIVLVLATMRAVRILRWDEITAGLRGWSVAKLGVDSKITYLLHCHRCLSFWCGLVPPAAYILWPTNRLIHLFILALAISEAAILIHDRTEAAGSH
jgi:Protein of unknown function (DUF1360)